MKMADMVKMADRRAVLSQVWSQENQSLDLPTDNKVSREDVKEMIEAQKSIMESNEQVRVKARKLYLIILTLVVVFLLGLMIGIVVYKDGRIRKLDSKNHHSILKLNTSLLDTLERLQKLERKKLKSLVKEVLDTELIKKQPMTVDEVLAKIRPKIKEEVRAQIQQSKVNETQSENSGKNETTREN